MEVWRESLRRHSFDVAMRSLNEHYATTKHPQPNLAAILGPVKREGVEVVKTPEDFDQYIRAKIERENEQTDFDLSSFTDAEMEDAKATILQHEPNREWMKDMPAKGRAWRDLIYERLVHNRAAVYKRGAAEPAAWIMTADYWESLRQQKQLLAAEMAKSRQMRVEAEKHLATIAGQLGAKVVGGGQ
jgi:hypothetical protein